MLLVGVDAAGLRRRLGPVAWCVLEALVDARGRSDGDSARASVRSLAGELALSKNTVHRAFGVLRDAGVLATVGQRRSAHGRFSDGVYLLDVPSNVLAPVSAHDAHLDSRPTRTRVHTTTRSHDLTEQLTLLTED